MDNLISNQDEENKKVSSRQRRQKIEELDKLRKAQKSLRETEFSSLHSKTRFAIIHAIQDFMLEEEKTKNEQLKEAYRNQSVFSTVIGLATASFLPQPIKSYRRLNKFYKSIIVVSLFLVTHQAFMFNIEVKTYDYHTLLIQKYQQQFLEHKYEL